MKTLIYTIYALTVLLFAGFARAESVTLMSVVNGQDKFKSPVAISAVGLNQQNLNLHVEGRLPTPCHLDPSAVLIFDKNNPSTLIVRFISPSPTAACMFKIKPFETVVDLKQLAQASELLLDDKALYVIRTEGYNFSLEVSGQDLKN